MQWSHTVVEAVQANSRRRRQTVVWLLAAPSIHTAQPMTVCQAWLLESRIPACQTHNSLPSTPFTRLTRMPMDRVQQQRLQQACLEINNIGINNLYLL